MIIMLTLMFLLFDVISKIIVIKSLDIGQSVTVINNFFNITYVRNTGVAWSLLNNKQILILIVSFLIILGIIFYIFKNRPKNIYEKLAYSMILSGAIGNFIDRIIHNGVIDFLDFNIFGYDYPIFNLADCFVVIGVIILIIVAWRCNTGGNSSRRK